MHRALRLRLRQKRAKPAFRRQNWPIKRLADIWRAPKGSQSKLRRHKKERGFLPSPGYGSPLAAKGLHPSGLLEVLVHNEFQLAGLDPAKHCVRIAKTVGALKRAQIQTAAERIGLRILNKKTIEIKGIKKGETEKGT
jgi:large subunit ribosomal protein L32e